MKLTIELTPEQGIRLFTAAKQSGIVGSAPENLAESGPDFSQEICRSASINDLEREAIEVFRQRWFKKTGNGAIQSMSPSQLLEDSELTTDGQRTFAALILLGSTKALGRHLPNAEIIWEYRAEDGQIESSQRVEFRRGFRTFHDELWTQVNARNDVISVRERLFRRDIPAFNEEATREAILNSVCHRNYPEGGSVFLRQFPKRMEVRSPGGLPAGITPENILVKQLPRNRRLAEACGKCGLVERSGQGMDRIFDASLREGKGVPDFTGTDKHEVVLILSGDVIDRKFVNLLDLAEKHNIELNVHHLLVLDTIKQGATPPPSAADIVAHLVHIGLVERTGRGKQTRLIFSRGMYRYLGEPGTYTRYKGLDRETLKQLLIAHMKGGVRSGCPLSELRQVAPHLTYDQVRHLLRELQREGKVRLVGRTSRSRWHLAEDGPATPGPPESRSP